MTNRNSYSTGSTIPLDRSREEEIKEICSTNLKNCEHILITHMRVTDLAHILHRHPEGFYVTVEFYGIVTKTSTKFVSIGNEVAEWDEEILLPANRSSAISFQVYPSSELGSKLRKCEILQQFKISVGEVIDQIDQLEPIRPLASGNAFDSSRPSLSIIAKRRNSDTSGYGTIPPLHTRNVEGDLNKLTEDGRRAFLGYHRFEHQVDLNTAITCFGHALHGCPKTHPMYSTAQFNLANAMFIDCQANNYALSLDVPIKLYRDALRNRPMGHPAHVQTILQLSLALLVRFQRRGDEKDKKEQTELLATLVKPSPADGHSYEVRRRAPQDIKDRVSFQVKPSQGTRGEDSDSNNAAFIYGCKSRPQVPKPSSKSEAEKLTDEGHHALSCYHQDQCQDQIHLDKAIWCFERVCDSYSIDHPNRSAALFNLANAKFIHCVNNNFNLDLDIPIALYRDALRLRTTGHPDYVTTVLELGLALLARFRTGGDEMDRMEAKEFLDRVMGLAPIDSRMHDGARLALQMLNVERDSKASESVDNADLIDRARAMLRTSSHSDPRRPARLAWLGNLLYARFQEHRDLVDIHEAVSMMDEAVLLLPTGHADKPKHLNGLGASLSGRFDHLRNAVDIERSIFVLEEGWHLTPDDDPIKLQLSNNLGSSLRRRFEHRGDVADITKSISILEEAVHHIPDGNPDKPVLLENLGNSVLCRFERFGDVADITKSVSTFEEAVHLTPDGHPHKPSLFNNLANSLSCRFERLGDVVDITKSVLMFEEAIYLTPDNHPNKSRAIGGLGSALYERFRCLGDVSDITKSVSMIEEALRLIPDGHLDKPGLLSNLCISLSRRFECLGDVADLARSVFMIEEAIRLTPDGNPHKPNWFNSLGLSLARRFECLGDLADLVRSVSMLEEAVRLTPDDHPYKPKLLNNLGSLLSCRFDRFDDAADSTKSVSMLEEAVRLTPDGHIDKAAWLSNLGNSLSRRFECLGDIADMKKSVSMKEEAVRLTLDGHPSKPSLLSNLGNVLINYFDYSRDPAHLLAAASYFSSAAQYSTGPASIRFQAARMWIRSAQVEGNSKTLLDACTTALDLLPNLAWMGLPLSERHRLLIGAAGIARGAAAAALEAGFPDMAVEWLEQGRSVVWNQFLQLRTPVDILRATHPALADEFEQTSKELENANSREEGMSNLVETNLGPNSWSLEQVIQRHHTLTLRREMLLANIRSLPDFDRFLLPKTIKELATLATSGPVVYLNASAKRCDALIVTAQLGNVIPVSLSDVTDRHVERMRQLLLERDRPTVPTDDMILLTPSGERSAIYREGGPADDEHCLCDRFQLVLRFLWHNVVNPILNALDFLTLPSEGQKMPRIFWCPTGPFAFLPIHAAGIYGTSPPGPKLSDFAISSYIPTLSALTPSNGNKGSGHPSNIRLVAVPQPSTDGQSSLPSVRLEIDHIRALSAESQSITLQHSTSTVEDVMAKMSDADWVHFACHGVQDPVHPLDSGLCLADRRRLKLSDIIRLSRPQGGLAFLSACETAQGDEKLSEESVHLAAGMLLAGYGGVIATMWSIMDNDAPKVARDVYRHLFRDGKVPDTTEAAEALHRAVVRLRDEDKVPFASWVPFIHVGR